MLILISIVKMVITRVTRSVLEHIHCKVFIRFSVHKFFVEIITDDDRLKTLTDNQGNNMLNSIGFPVFLVVNWGFFCGLLNPLAQTRTMVMVWC